MTIKIIVLDRDGVINQDSPFFIKSPAEWHPLHGSLEAIHQLNQHGYKVVVATNQSGLARGYFTVHDLEEIHRKMQDELAIVGGRLDGVFVCPHGPQDGCACRKPEPGLLLEIAKHFGVQPQEMLSIGDSMRDLVAARRAGCQRILVKTGNGAKTILEAMAQEDGKNELENVAVFDDLATAVKAIILNANRV